MDTTSRHPPSNLVDRQAAAFARTIVSEKFANSDATLREKWKDTFASIHDVTGALRSAEWLGAEIERVVATRIYWWEIKMVPHPVAVRRRPIMTQRNSGGRTIVSGAAYRSITFGVGPINSYALFLAAEAGYACVVRQFLHFFGATVVDRFQVGTKAHVIAAAIHPDPWTTHATCLWSPWSEPTAAMAANPENSACLPVGIKRRFRAFSPKLTGVLHQAALGFDTDRLTGRYGSVSQAMWYLQDARRHQNPLNYLMERWARLWIHQQLSQPKWRLLCSYFTYAAVAYRWRKAEQLSIMAKLAQRDA